ARPLARKVPSSSKNFRNALVTILNVGSLLREGMNILEESHAVVCGQNSPPQPRRGGRDIKKNIAKHPLWSGRSGAGQCSKKSNSWSTPPRLRGLRSLRVFFSLRASTPPRLRRGALARLRYVILQVC